MKKETLEKIAYGLIAWGLIGAVAGGAAALSWRFFKLICGGAL